MPRHRDCARNRQKPRRRCETKTHRVSSRVTVSLYQQIEAIAAEEDRSGASVLRRLISIGLRARPQETPRASAEARKKELREFPK